MEADVNHRGGGTPPPGDLRQPPDLAAAQGMPRGIPGPEAWADGALLRRGNPMGIPMESPGISGTPWHSLVSPWAAARPGAPRKSPGGGDPPYR